MNTYDFLDFRFKLMSQSSEHILMTPYKMTINPKLKSQKHYNTVYPSDNTFTYQKENLEICQNEFLKYYFEGNVYTENKFKDSIESYVYLNDGSKNYKYSKELACKSIGSHEVFSQLVKKIFNFKESERLYFFSKLKLVPKNAEMQNYGLYKNQTLVGGFSIFSLSNAYSLLGNAGLIKEYRGKGFSADLFLRPLFLSQKKIVLDTSNPILVDKVLKPLHYKKVGTLFLTPIKALISTSVKKVCENK